MVSVKSLPVVASPAPAPVLRPPEREGPSATCAIVRVPFEEEEMAISLLKSLQDEVFSDKPRAIPSRLWTAENIELTYEELREAGFEIADVETAIRLCGPTPADCFDYLSLNLPLARLPKGWAAEGVAETVAVKQVLLVSKPKPSASSESSAAESSASSPFVSAHVPPIQVHKSLTQRDQVETIDKAWIMQRYQQMDDSDSEEMPLAAATNQKEQMDDLKQQVFFWLPLPLVKLVENNTLTKQPKKS